MENRKGYGLETDVLPAFNSFYLAGAPNPRDPLVSPIFAEDLSNLPAAFVITAKHDPLRDEGEKYADKLRAAGVEVHTKRTMELSMVSLQNGPTLKIMRMYMSELASF